MAKFLQSRLFSPFKSATSLKECSEKRTQTTRKQSAKKKLGLPPKTGYNLSSETTPPPPPKINPNFFSKKAMLNYYFNFFSFYIDVIIKNALLRALLPLSWGQNKQTSVINTKIKQKKKLAKILQSRLFRRSSQPQAWKSAQNNARKQPKKIGQKNLGCPPKTGYSLSSETTPTPPPPPKKK